MSLVQERVRQRLDATGMTPRGASVRAGLGPDAIRLILSGRSEMPRADRLAKLAQVLGCSLEWLMGRSDEMGETEPLLPDAIDTPLARGIRKRLEELGESPIAVAAKVGMGRTFVLDILRGKSRSPSFEAVEKLAAALECSVDQLLGRSMESAPPPLARMRTPVSRFQMRLTDNGRAIISMNEMEVPLSVAVKIVAMLEGDG